jgi:hypothetical protein
MADKIDVPATSENVTNITVIKKVPTQKTVNSILIAAAAFIILTVVLSFFAELNIFTDITIKEVSTSALWVFLGSYSVSCILKQVGINRAKETKEYKEQKAKTIKELQEIAERGAFIYADEYCRAYELNAMREAREHVLIPVGLTLEMFDNKYKAKSFFYLAKNNRELSIKQLIAIAKANAVKLEYYNSDFLRRTVYSKRKKSPSAQHDTQSKNLAYNIRSFVLGFMGCAFAVSIAKDLVFSFSMEALVAALIKIALIVISGAFALSFGWNLIMETELNRLKLQVEEAQACEKWTSQHYDTKAIKVFSDPIEKAETQEKLNEA